MPNGRLHDENDPHIAVGITLREMLAAEDKKKKSDSKPDSEGGGSGPEDPDLLPAGGNS